MNLYFDQSLEVTGIRGTRAKEMYDAWKILVQKAAACNCTISIDDQRVILATLSSIFFDLMSVKLKDKKMEDTCPAQTTCTLYNESMVSIYRYSGFAIHSMVKNRKHSLKKSDEDKVLEAMMCKRDELDSVPKQVWDLSRGDLCTVSPKIIPFVQLLLKKITLNINEDQLKAKGHMMIELAKSTISSDAELLQVFDSCINDVNGDEFDKCCLKKIRMELMNKIINARINEFFKARKELELEANHKVVDAEQSLRDTLKTFSTVKSRI